MAKAAIISWSATGKAWAVGTCAQKGIHECYTKLAASAMAASLPGSDPWRE